MKCLLAPRSRCWGNCQARQAGITHYQKYKMFNFAFWWNSCSGLWSGPNCAGTCLPPGNSGCWQGGEPGAHTHQTSQDRLGSVIRPMSTSQHSTLNTQHSTLNTQHTVSWRVRAVSLQWVVWCGLWTCDYEKMIISHHHSLLAWSRSTQSPHYLLITLDNFTQAAPITKTDETIFDISQFYLWCHHLGVKSYQHGLSVLVWVWCCGLGSLSVFMLYAGCNFKQGRIISQN